MSNFIAAKDIMPTDKLVQWTGYTVVRFEAHPSRNDGRILLRDRYGDRCWTPVKPDETVEIETRA
jgi:hypothetical protein